MSLQSGCLTTPAAFDQLRGLGSTVLLRIVAVLVIGFQHGYLMVFALLSIVSDRVLG